MAEPSLPATIDKADPVHSVYEWIIAGNSEHAILEALSAQFPRHKHSKVLVEAMARISKAAAADGDLIRGWCIESTRELYRKAIEGNDLATALRAIKQLWDFTR